MGVLQLMNIATMSYKFVPDYMPYKDAWVLLSGIFLIVATLCLVLERYERQAALALAGYMIALVILIYIPHTFDPNRREAALPDLLQSLIIAGGALLYASMISKNEG